MTPYLFPYEPFFIAAMVMLIVGLLLYRWRVGRRHRHQASISQPDSTGS